MDDMYHNCRWCRYNDKGKCLKSSDVFNSPANKDLYKLSEDGILSEALQEGLSFPKMIKVKSLLKEFGISQKRQNEILKAVGTELEDSIPTIIEGLDESVSQLLNKQNTVSEDLELKDPESFYCKYFE